jgi:hypothetical protein
VDTREPEYLKGFRRVVGDLTRLKLLVLNTTSEWLSEARFRVLFREEERQDIADLIDKEPVNGTSRGKYLRMMALNPPTMILKPMLTPSLNENFAATCIVSTAFSSLRIYLYEALLLYLWIGGIKPRQEESSTGENF